jgi:hypothetical protein
MSKAKKRSSIPLLAIVLGVLLILGASFLLYLNQVDDPSLSTDTSGPEGQETGVARISLEEAKAAFDSGEAVFVDVRDALAYQENHIPGAVSIPLAELEARLGELDPDDWIITYCT